MLKSAFQGLTILALLVVSGYFLWKLGLVAYERYELQRAINEAKAEVAKLEQSNGELQKLLAQLGNQEFLTLKLKEELNVKEAGEHVAIVKPKPETKLTPAQAQESQALDTGYWPKWWKLFFAQ